MGLDIFNSLLASLYLSSGFMIGEYPACSNTWWWTAISVYK